MSFLCSVSHSRKRAAFHGSSSTSSSSSEALDPSDDERKFERRKAKSMAKARQRCVESLAWCVQNKFRTTAITSSAGCLCFLIVSTVSIVVSIVFSV